MLKKWFRAMLGLQRQRALLAAAVMAVGTAAIIAGAAAVMATITGPAHTAIWKIVWEFFVGASMWVSALLIMRRSK